MISVPTQDDGGAITVKRNVEYSSIEQAWLYGMRVNIDVHAQMLAPDTRDTLDPLL